MEEALNVALDPAYLNEAVFKPPVEEGEETKAIPIITDDRLHGKDQEETIIHTDNKTPETKNDKSPAPKKKRFYKRKGFIATVLILLLVGAALTIFALNGPKDVTIPDDLIGMEYEEAKEELENLNLKVNKELIPSEEVEEGNVVKTDPGAGRTVKEKSTVDVFVSDGKKKEEFGDYVGKNYNQVKRILEDEGYEVIAYEKVSDQPVGEIITQIQPTPGSEVVPSETTVIFEISNGPEKFVVSNLTGSTVAQAEDYAEKNGLKIEHVEEHSDNVEKGKIISQSPSANTEVAEGSTIKVVVSKGPRSEEHTSELQSRGHLV